MNGQSNGSAIYVVFAILIVIGILRRRGVSQTQPGSLNKGERQRPVAITWLDPVISILFVGTVLWGLATRNFGHAAIALVGALAGIPIGLARARTMYVRAVRETKSVIFRRSALEYGLLGVLLLLRLVETSIAKMHSGFATYALTALVALAVAESITRAAAIVWRYHHERPAESAAD